MRTNLIISFLFIVFSELVHAAACCGGSFVVPNLIVGEDQSLLTGSFSYSNVDTDVLSNGVWKKRKQSDITQTYKLEGATLISDRFQAGFTVPFQTKLVSSQGSQSNTGLGDISAVAGYEILTDWDYNEFKPKGLSFISISLPTGKSVYESETGLDARGSGLWNLGVGVTFIKTWIKWDLNATAQVHRSFEKSFLNEQGTFTIRPGNGSSLMIGSGYNYKDCRLGGSISSNYEYPIDVDGSMSSKGVLKRFTTGALMASYLFASDWGASLSYSDQTLFGEPLNSTLAKTAIITLQKKWAR